METPNAGTDDERDVVVDLNKQDEIVDTNGDKDDSDKDKGREASKAVSEESRGEPVEERAAPRGEDEEDVRGDRETRNRGESSEDYSRRVQARINRERALRIRSDHRVDEVSAENRELRDRLARVERRQNAQTVSEDGKKKVADLQKEIDAITVQLKAVMEAGETAKQLELQVALQEKIGDKKLLEQRIADQAQRATQDAGQPGREEHEEEASPEEQRIKRNTSRWQESNRKWWNLKRFSDVKADAIEIDKDIRQEVRNGDLDMEEYSDEYFDLLSTRLKKLYPELDVRSVEGDVVEGEQDDVDPRRGTPENDRSELQRSAARPRRPAGGDMGTRDRRRDNGDDRTMAGRGKVKLTQADFATMRTFGLDPQNQDHTKRFARERMRTILTGDVPRRGGGR